MKEGKKKKNLNLLHNGHYVIYQERKNALILHFSSIFYFERKRGREGGRERIQVLKG